MPAGKTIAARRNVPAPKPVTPIDPTNLPAVFRQQAADAAKWTGRGVKVALCYEPNNGAVSVKQWDASWVGAGAKLIREPSGDNAYDNGNPNLLAVLCRIQEPDNTAVSEHDRFVTNWATNPPTLSDPKAAAAAVEAVYASVEAECKGTRAAIPNKPIALVVGGEQFRYGKVDMVRLAAAVEYLIVDWYAVHRGKPIAELFAMVDKLNAATGNKVLYVCVECSNQRLALSSYPDARCPTVAEMIEECDGAKVRKAGACLFPQQVTEGGFPFLYDAMPAELVAAFATWAGKPVPPAPSPLPPAAKGPLDGKDATIDGHTYFLTAK